MDSGVRPGGRLRAAERKQAEALAGVPEGAIITAIAPVARSVTRRSIRVGGHRGADRGRRGARTGKLRR